MKFASIILLSLLTATAAHAEEEYGPGFWSEEQVESEEGKFARDQGKESMIGVQEQVDEMYDFYLDRDDFGAFSGIEALLRFSQTSWDECRDSSITGNYYTVGCSSRRTIASIFKQYLNDHLLKCIDEGLAAQGGGRAARVHVIHAGITADPRHSPRSLHSENRAMDVKVIRASLTNGNTRQFTYALSGNRPFYTALRQCWGKRVNQYNGCPLVKGTSLYTGSIGWEDRNHGQHMHLSIPYCVGGQYGSGFYQR